jgi:acyl-CoA thioester hydrolase
MKGTLESTILSSPSTSNFRWPVRVYYEDTDAGGVVYHANYLRFMERARSERLRGLGFELDELRRDHDLLFVVRSLEIDFLKPARFNDRLWVTANLDRIRSVSLYFRQAVVRNEDELLCEARVRVVCLSAENFRPRVVPEFLRQRLNGH